MKKKSKKQTKKQQKQKELEMAKKCPYFIEK